MFREMRLKDQLIPEKDAIDVIKRNGDGILSVNGDEGYPYGVPVNYAYDDGKIYFHCAKAGHKLDAIRKDGKVCFTIRDANEVDAEEFNTYYRSVILFGKARVVEDEKDMRNALRIIAGRFSPEFLDKAEMYINKNIARTSVVIIDIEHIAGKQSAELF